KGKLSYMSPELVTGGKIDHRSDIFALGTLLYEMLTLKRLFMGKSELHTLSNIREARITRRMQRHDYIPDGVQEIIRRALAREPDERFQSALELEEAVADYLFEERIRTNASTIARFMAELFPERPGGGAVPAAKKKRRRATLPDAAAGGAADADAVDDTDAEGVLEDADSDDSSATSTFDEFAHAEEPARVVSDEDTLEDEIAGLAPAAEGGDGSDTWLTERDALDDLIDAVQAARAPAMQLQLPDAPGDASARLALSTFRVRSGPRAEILGPISAYNMGQLLRSRAVSGDEEVSVDGGPWTRIAASELRPLLPEVLADTGTPLHEGGLERARLPRLFLRLHAARANGMLAVARGWMRKELYYEDGVLVHVHSNLREELFARSVVADGIVPGDAVQRALEHARVQRIQLGEALVALGLLTENALRHVLIRQQERRFRELFSWPDGRFAWFGDVPVPDYARGEGLDVPSLIAGVVRGAFTAGELAAWLGPVKEHALVLRTADVIDPAKLGLEVDEQTALEALTTGATLAEAAERAGESAALRVAYLLLQADLAAVAPSE
ncbi:MAG: protein kinase, partial [Myxococcales bacterium]|nr:protein kinase [Myxococcales bacterium]